MLFLMAASVTAALAQSASDVVLVENRWVKLTRADYEAELRRIPPDLRGSFGVSGKRIAGLLNNLLVVKTLAAQGREAGLESSVPAGATGAELERQLARLETRRIEEKAGADFDAKAVQLQPRVRELYVLDRKKYRRPEQIRVSQILFGTTSRSDEAALALAKQTRDQIVAGADFDKLVREISDQPTAKADGGRIDWFSAAQKDMAFAKPAFELKSVGEVSEPIRTSAGYHLLRLDERRAEAELTFEEAGPLILAELRRKYVTEQREQRVNAIRNDPQMKINQAAVDALVVKVDARSFKPQPANPPGKKLPPPPPPKPDAQQPADKPN